MAKASIILSDNTIATIAELLLEGASVEEVATRYFMEERRYDQQTWLSVAQQIQGNMQKHIPQVKAMYKERIRKIVALIVISLILVVANVVIAMMAGVIYIALGIMCAGLFIMGCVKYFPLAQKRDTMLDAVARWNEQQDEKISPP